MADIGSMKSYEVIDESNPKGPMYTGGYWLSHTQCLLAQMGSTI